MGGSMGGYGGGYGGNMRQPSYQNAGQQMGTGGAYGPGGNVYQMRDQALASAPGQGPSITDMVGAVGQNLARGNAAPGMGPMAQTHAPAMQGGGVPQTQQSTSAPQGGGMGGGGFDPAMLQQALARFQQMQQGGYGGGYGPQPGGALNPGLSGAGLYNLGSGGYYGGAGGWGGGGYGGQIAQAQQQMNPYMNPYGYGGGIGQMAQQAALQQMGAQGGNGVRYF
jgi:hypothetical protein